jgi:hypothetical protein
MLGVQPSRLRWYCHDAVVVAGSSTPLEIVADVSSSIAGLPQVARSNAGRCNAASHCKTETKERRSPGLHGMISVLLIQ